MDIFGRDIFSGRRSLFGMDVIEAPVRYVPILKLSYSAPVSDEFRTEMDVWLLDLFGNREVSILPLGSCFTFGNIVVMRPEHLAIIRSMTV